MEDFLLVFDFARIQLQAFLSDEHGDDDDGDEGGGDNDDYNDRRPAPRLPNGELKTHDMKQAQAAATRRSALPVLFGVEATPAGFGGDFTSD
ncbi:hypothetical protein XA68_18226 [Ophiocordyceps unilateralis]|uniref:Uncharacterized protein n=1 Tax=Ophiocordyceps unilateralis TaxID=268505 RepID=A0A2A9PNZ1_OPHUN|nr:hypothetical protein XA68_18226 [Ophiocordyceps unilateralis]